MHEDVSSGEVASLEVHKHWLVVQNECSPVLMLNMHTMLQALTGMGSSEEELDVDLQSRLAEAKHEAATDDAINGVLLLSAQAQIAQLRNATTQVCSTTLCAFNLYVQGSSLWLSDRTENAMHCRRSKCIKGTVSLEVTTLWYVLCQGSL